MCVNVYLYYTLTWVGTSFCGYPLDRFKVMVRVRVSLQEINISCCYVFAKGNNGNVWDLAFVIVEVRFTSKED